MRKSATFLSIMLLAQCVAIPLHAAERLSCQLTEYESIDLIVTPSDNIVIPITVGGNATYALLDLGSAFNSISPSATEELKVTRQRLQTPRGVEIIVGGKKIVEITDRVPVSIGKLGFGSTDFLVTTEIGIEITRVTVKVGMTFFAGVDVELDFVGKKMKFFSQDHCPGDVVYWSDRVAAAPFRRDPSGSAYLIMELAGKKVEAEMATTAGVTYLHAGAAKALFGIDANNRDRPVRQQFMELTTNGLSVMNAQVYLAELRGTSCRFREQKGADKAAGYVNCYNIFPLQLGMNVLKNMHIYIATKENVLYFTAADARR